MIREVLMGGKSKEIGVANTESATLSDQAGTQAVPWKASHSDRASNFPSSIQEEHEYRRTELQKWDSADLATAMDTDSLQGRNAVADGCRKL